ncbi:hypothetical protein WA026_010015 [Henosepilachna vigintioctopunctata]|uniref:Secreted peptide n=1 Tax=Henosepilachna vigintioctopunctata TaxID=420089 RepID=A0AAW1TSE0_9CUCU
MVLVVSRLRYALGCGALSLPLLIFLLLRRGSSSNKHNYFTLGRGQDYGRDFRIPLNRCRLGCVSPGTLGLKLFNLLNDDIKSSSSILI